MGKTANLELNTTEMSDKISDFVGEYNSNMNMLDDLYGDVQDDASSALSTAQSAETKATAAQTAATNAVTTANSANTTAQSAVSTANSANTTAGQANTKADNAVATANTAKDTADEAKETAETASADVADKADVDGTYDGFTAGNAKQLLSTVHVDDNEPYNFRTAGGSADIGDRMYEEVVGGSIVWHQWIHPVNTTYMSFTAEGTIENGVATFTATQQYQGVSYTSSSYNSGSIVTGHKYLRMFDVRANEDAGASGQLYWPAHNQVNLQVNFSSLTVGQWKTVASIVPATADYSYYQFSIYDNRSSGWTSVSVRNIMAIDLTQMFGSTIADYIYSLEQGTAGAGVAWFRNLFPKPYYAYNAGELMSVKAGSHDTVGFNAWDEEWERATIDWNTYMFAPSASGGRLSSKNYIPVLPNTSYCMTPHSNVVVVGYESNTPLSGKIIEPNLTTGVFVTPSDCHYIKFGFNTTQYGTTYNHDICINLSWDGERNGEYEPYEKHTYPLAELELRGIPKLDANNQLYYDGDTYASDGTVTRKYGIVDLGTLTWSRDAQPSYARFLGNLSTVTGMAVRKVNGLCLKYEVLSNNETFETSWDKVVYLGGGQVFVHDNSYTDATTFKSAMNGVYLVYELAEPTTETADAFTNPQIINDFGTEEYVDYAVEAGDRDVAIPVGHNSQYMNNLRAKLEMAPDSPSGDGKYIVQQSNGENAYIPYTADGRLDAIEAKLPAPPSANGTYKLTATVSNNGVTYSWQS